MVQDEDEVDDSEVELGPTVCLPSPRVPFSSYLTRLRMICRRLAMALRYYTILKNRRWFMVRRSGSLADAAPSVPSWISSAHLAPRTLVLVAYLAKSPLASLALVTVSSVTMFRKNSCSGFRNE